MEQHSPPSYNEAITNPAFSVSPPLDHANQTNPEESSYMDSNSNDGNEPSNLPSNSNVQHVDENSSSETSRSRSRSNNGASDNVMDSVAGPNAVSLSPTSIVDSQQQNATTQPLTDNEPPPPSYEDAFISSSQIQSPTQAQEISASQYGNQNSQNSEHFYQPPPSYNAVVNRHDANYFYNPRFSNLAQMRDANIITAQPTSYAMERSGNSFEQTYMSVPHGNYTNQGYQRMPYIGTTSNTTTGTGSYVLHNANEQTGVSTPTLVIYNADNPSTSTSSGIQGYNTTPLAYVDPNAIPSEKSNTSRIIPICFCIVLVFIPLVFYLSVF